jgi:dihydropteroate synthase
VDAPAEARDGSRPGGGPPRGPVTSRIVTDSQARTSAGVELELRGQRVVRDRALVMAIVNRTPDSFYDQGATFADAAARQAIRTAVAEGAELIDIGGVAASPGDDVDTEAEIARVVPTVEWIRETFPDVLISIDTWRHEVGRAACAAGAHLLNDAWQAADPKLMEVAAEFGAGYVCTHTGGRDPRAEPVRPDYPDVVRATLDEVLRLAERAEQAGVPRSAIVIDGTGFGKNTPDHLVLVRHTRDFVAAGFPVLMALSNKTFVGDTLDVGLHDRLVGTLAATALAADAGAAIFRAHQVAPTRETLEMVASIGGHRPPHHVSEWIS